MAELKERQHIEARDRAVDDDAMGVLLWARAYARLDKEGFGDAIARGLLYQFCGYLLF